MVTQYDPLEPSADRRIEKLVGAKVFASDLRPADLTKRLNWPSGCSHALILRAQCLNRNIEKLCLDRLGNNAKPDITVCAEKLNTFGLNNLRTDKLFHLIPIGMPAQYLSQPIAILIFDDFMAFRRAAHEIREDRGIVTYGKVEISEPDKNLDELLADWQQLKAPANASDRERAHYILAREGNLLDSQWNGGKLKRLGERFVREKSPDSTAANDVYLSLRELRSGALCIETTTYTQQVDPAFLEPECGLAAISGGVMTVVSGTQSASNDAGEIRAMLGLGIAGQAPTHGVRSVDVLSVDSGGGFGGRDKSPHAVQLALAAFFSNQPVRLAYDRFEQFQAGLKRHGSVVNSRISATPDGALDRIHVHFIFDGSVDLNLGAAVLGLGALHATGPYRYRRAGIHGLVSKRAVPIVGSMRGFGIPQVAFNIETAVDRLAVLNLRQDPIALRIENALRHDPDDAHADWDVAGTPLRFHVANLEVCKAALQHPLWQTREEERRTAIDRGLLRGVGFAACIEAYGTSGDVAYCAVELESTGDVRVWGHSVDMGQGARRTYARIVKSALGRVPKVDLTDSSPFVGLRDLLEPGTASPLAIGASSASKTAFFHVHVLKEALRALLELRIYPAVRAILSEDALTDEIISTSRMGSVFRVPGRAAVPLDAVAAHLAESGGERFIVARGRFANGWTFGRFDDAGRGFSAFLNGLAFATHSGAGQLRQLAPTGPLVVPDSNGAPRSGYAAGGHLLAVELNRTTRRIQVKDAVAFLDAGDPIVPTVLAGQVEGGLQMGLAHALFEELPPESGEDRFVNFDRYILPRASDIVSTRLETVLIPLPLSGALNEKQPNIRHKGIAEATMTTVAPALANAIAHALGHAGPASWPFRLPIRFDDLSFSGT